MSDEDERLESERRRERIGELLIEELRAHGDLDAGDVPTHWTALVGTHVYAAEDHDHRDDGAVVVVTSVPTPPLHAQLGLLDGRRIDIQAVMVRAWMQADADED